VGDEWWGWGWWWKSAILVEWFLKTSTLPFLKDFPPFFLKNPEFESLLRIKNK
jgi:hypothetical protein